MLILQFFGIWEIGPQKRKKAGHDIHDQPFVCESGSDLLSHRASPAVPSARKDFTSVFGMGTGVTPSL